MIITTKNGYEFQVDPEDEALAREAGWSVMTDTSRAKNKEISSIRKYVVRNRNNHTEYLHRTILKAPEGTLCDHINGNGLDNRRANIRFATNSQNSANRKIGVRNKSGYKGVHWSSRDNKWRVQFKVNKKTKYIGLFANSHEGALAYNRAMKNYFGEFARLNMVTLPLPTRSSI
jgi:hypothetical protein